MSIKLDEGANKPELVIPTVETFLSPATVEALVGFRRELHRNPELGYKEFRTTERIRTRLIAAGLEPRALPDRTGLICDIGPKNGPLVGLRADLDALPIQDKTDTCYRSGVQGVAHACGHDVHTTMLLGAALYLAQLARYGQLPRGVRVFFQPAEEVAGGAKKIIEAGGLDGVERVFALHCDPKIEVGQLGLIEGPITASIDMLRLEVYGPGGHTARPHLTTDLIPALAKIVVELQQALDRRIDARSGLVLDWGVISAGTKANVIPGFGFAEGTLRCLGNQVRQEALETLDKALAPLAEFHMLTAELIRKESLPPTVNERESVQMLRDAAALMRIEPVDTEQSMGGEDFGLILEQRPGALARLGVRAPGSKVHHHDLHTSLFDVDERCIPVGIRAMVAAVLIALGATRD